MSDEMIDFSKEGAGSDELGRHESWPVKGPAELELSVDVGTVVVDLENADAEEVTVEVRHDPSAA